MTSIQRGSPTMISIADMMGGGGFMLLTRHLNQSGTKFWLSSVTNLGRSVYVLIGLFPS